MKELRFIIWFLIVTLMLTCPIYAYVTPLDVLDRAYNFTKPYEPWELNPLSYDDIVYPSQLTEYKNYKIYISTSQFNDTPHSAVLHEFGHHVLEELRGPCLFCRIMYNIGKGIFEINGKAINSDSNTYHAFEEGWAVMFTSAVMDDSHVDNLHEIESTRYSKNGERNVGEVANILWDISDDNDSFDSFPSSDDDQISGEFSKIWNIIKLDKPRDILQFYSYWFNHGYDFAQYKNDLYSIYEEHGISKPLLDEEFSKTNHPPFFQKVGPENDWPFKCHDLKRSCTSTLKGDVRGADDNDEYAWRFNELGQGFNNPTISDINGDGLPEIIVTTENKSGYISKGGYH